MILPGGGESRLARLSRAADHRPAADRSLVLLRNARLKPLKRLRRLSSRNEPMGWISLLQSDALRVPRLRLRLWLRECRRPELLMTVLLRPVPREFSLPVYRLMSMW